MTLLETILINLLLTMFLNLILPHILLKQYMLTFDYFNPI